MSTNTKLIIIAATTLILIAFIYNKNKNSNANNTNTTPEYPASLPTVEKSVFKQWRSPIRGEKHPHNMYNTFWHWCIETEKSGFSANQHFKGPSPFKKGPTWSFDRFGQTTTKLPNGSTVYIAGEHEDHYDPDFYIYNDVIIKHPDGKVEIYGYPEDIFPPTDFHTATLLDSKILIIGNLGYQEGIDKSQTPIYQLDTKTWQITPIKSTGQNPGWISRHKTTLSKDKSKLIITKGKILTSELLTNYNDWQLNLKSMTWTKLTNRNWNQWA